MTREELMKLKIKAYMEIIYTQHNGTKLDCILIEVNFHNETMLLEPVDTILYKEQEFVANIKNCEPTPFKLRLIRKPKKDENTRSV